MLYFSFSSLAQVEIPEGKGAQQVLEALQRKVELAGAVRSGNWSVDCETYYSTQNTGLCMGD